MRYSTNMGNEDQKNKDLLQRKKRNIYIGRNRTSLSFEQYVWDNIDRIAREENISVDDICSKIEEVRNDNYTLSTLIRYIVHEVTDLRQDITSENSFDMAETAHPFPSPLYVALSKIKKVKHL